MLRELCRTNTVIVSVQKEGVEGQNVQEMQRHEDMARVVAYAVGKGKKKTPKLNRGRRGRHCVCAPHAKETLLAPGSSFTLTPCDPALPSASGPSASFLFFYHLSLPLEHWQAFTV